MDKVVEVFSAIIQLPLLRQADDKRRYGPLAAQRLMEYREAKRAVEQVGSEGRIGRGRA